MVENKETVLLRMTAEQKEQIEQAARKDMRSVNSYIVINIMKIVEGE